MLGKYQKYMMISMLLMAVCYLVMKPWLIPDPKGVEHSLLYIGLAVSFSVIASLLIVIQFFLSKPWINFLKTFFALANCLFLFLLLRNLHANISVLLLFGYTALTGGILSWFVLQEMMKEQKEMERQRSAKSK